MKSTRRVGRLLLLLMLLLGVIGLWQHSMIAIALTGAVELLVIVALVFAVVFGQLRLRELLESLLPPLVVRFGMLAGVFAGVGVVEGVVIGLLLKDRFSWLAWADFVATAYGALWLLGIALAPYVYPHRLTNGTLEIRLGSSTT